MISVRIGNEQRSGDDITEEWINQQVNRRRTAGQGVCVQVTIEEGPVRFTLLSAGCGGGGGGHQLNPDEVGIWELWKKLGLSDPGFTGGNLNAFLKQVMKRL